MQYWFNNSPRIVSRFAESNKFYVGVKITATDNKIVSKGKSVDIKVSLTVPVMCKGGARNCSGGVQFVSPRKDILVTCPETLIFTATTWNVVQTVTLKTKADTKHVGVVKAHIKVMIIPQPSVLLLSLWTKHTQILMTVSESTKSREFKFDRVPCRLCMVIGNLDD